jgi:hypothetical protein
MLVRKEINMLHPCEANRLRASAIIPGMLILACALLTSGCTAVGFGIGAIVDANKPKQVEVPKSQWLDIRPGQSVLIMKRGDTATERFEVIGAAADTNGIAARPMDAVGYDAPISLRLRRSIYKERSPGRSMWTLDTLDVAADDIELLYKPRARNGRLYGALIGLAADVGTLIILALTWEDSWGFSGGGGW